MIVRKCDACRKTIKDLQNSVSAGYGYRDKLLCTKCGQPVLDFLQKKKLVAFDDKKLESIIKL